MEIDELNCNQKIFKKFQTLLIIQNNFGSKKNKDERKIN